MYPLLLYGLGEIANNSFEDPAGGLQAPTSWDLSASVNGVNETSVAYFHSAGDGIPSVQSLRQRVSGPTAGNIASARQRIAPADLLQIAVENDVELAFVAAMFAESQKAFDNAVIRFRQYNSTSDTPGDGILLTAPSERMFFAGGPTWYLAVFAAKIHAAAARIDVEVIHDIARAGFDVAKHVHWDRVFFGGLVDFDKRFRGGFSSRMDPGQRVNEGDGASEVVRTRGPRTEIDAEIRNVMDGSRLALELQAFNRWLAKGTGFCAVWRNRDEMTNATEHFQKVHVDRRFEVSMPAGPTRRDYDLRFIAPEEGNA